MKSETTYLHYDHGHLRRENIAENYDSVEKRRDAKQFRRDYYDALAHQNEFEVPVLKYSYSE